ncbi:putative MFS family arabinose efflux permease [Dongia mobilis]|uniref:Putative MFS family arabinose efflux permease n=2 Tax=Dongia mobilis TaxID=578943 RepID=A0A4R6WX98_9PROT|nr:MFS transporter [Dongia mobilis]TDQ84327.1 putative MFS family arabinose efflux permease [Dongia mobilis]
MSTKPTMISVLRNRDFLFLEINAFFGNLAAEILIVAVTWMIYDRTQDPVLLGLTGIVQFLPFLCLVLVTGSVADRYSRRNIIAASMVVEFVAMLGIALVSESATTDVWPIMALLALLAVGRAFFTPAARALAPNLVRRDEIGAAIACSTATWQFCSIAGPALGGLLYGISSLFAFMTALAMVALATVATLMIRPVPQREVGEHGMLASLLGGVRYMKAEKIVLGATTLDLFAVLFGTTIILLPIYARDILMAGPWELGVLRAAIGVGALLMALALGLYPIRRRAGHLMFAAVAIFGLGTIVFGFSTSLILSALALALMGASDMVSVYIREVLIQLWTPDELRGRVGAVNSVLINASNELGTFRAGIAAGAIGPVAATVLGGICTLAVTGLWMWWFPKLRQADDISGADSGK